MIPDPNKGDNHTPLPGYLLAHFYHMDEFLFFFFHKKSHQLHVKLQGNHIRQHKMEDSLLLRRIIQVGQVALPGLVLQQIVQGAVQYLRDTV